MSGDVLLVVVTMLVFVAALLFGQFIYWMGLSDQQAQARNLNRRLGNLVEKQATPLLRGPDVRPTGGFAARIDTLLRQAGNPYGAADVYLRMGVAAAFGVVVLFLVTRGPIALLGLGLAYGPYWLLAWSASHRAARLTEQIPDSLDLLARSLQAGHGISEAMRTVAEEVHPPLGQEFGRVYEEHNLGRDFRECLTNMLKRNPSSFDLQLFVSAVLLQRDTGGNLVEILQSISKTVRQRFLFQGKVEALTAEAKFTAYILGGLPFAIGSIIMVIRPDYLWPLVADPLGNLFLLVGAVMFTSGVVIMRELSRVES